METEEKNGAARCERSLSRSTGWEGRAAEPRRRAAPPWRRPRAPWRKEAAAVRFFERNVSRCKIAPIPTTPSISHLLSPKSYHHFFQTFIYIYASEKKIFKRMAANEGNGHFEVRGPDAIAISSKSSRSVAVSPP